MEFKTAYGPKLKSTLDDFEPTRTKQSMKEECDINFIVAKFQKTGLIEHQRQHEGQYGEFAEIDYHEAMNIVTTAQEMFLTVPSSIRKQFNNDPGAFIDFALNEDNREKLVEMGLVEPTRPPVPGLPPVDPPPTTGSPTTPAADAPATPPATPDGT